MKRQAWWFNSLSLSAYMCLSKLTIIVSDNGLSPGRHQAIIWNNDGILLIGLFGTNFNEILIEIHTFLFKKIHVCENFVCEMSAIYLGLNVLTDWGRVMHICVSKLTMNGSDNGLSPGRRQAIVWTNAGVVIFITIFIFSFKKMHFKLSSGNWRPICLGLNVLKVVTMTASLFQWLDKIIKGHPHIKVLSYQYRNSYNEVKMVIRSSYLYNGNLNSWKKLIAFFIYDEPLQIKTYVILLRLWFACNV